MLARHLARVLEPIRYAAKDMATLNREAALRALLAIQTRAYDLPRMAEHAGVLHPQTEHPLLRELLLAVFGHHDSSALAPALDVAQDAEMPPTARQRLLPVMSALAGLHDLVQGRGMGALSLPQITLRYHGAHLPATPTARRLLNVYRGHTGDDPAVHPNLHGNNSMAWIVSFLDSMQQAARRDTLGHLGPAREHVEDARAEMALGSGLGPAHMYDAMHHIAGLAAPMSLSQESRDIRSHMASVLRMGVIPILHEETGP